IILFFVLGFFLFSSLTYSHPPGRVDWDDDGSDTTRKKSNPDSIRDARTHVMDSIHDAHAHAADSAKMARKHTTDSVQTVRKHITDSSAAIRKYRESKHYKDSVAHNRLNKTNTLKAARQAHMDSLKDARKQATDNLTTSRKAKTDSIKTIQKRKSDSLAAIKKYKASKRYTDSVSVVKHERMDSIRNVQKATRDRMAAVRKHSLDSANTARKHSMDSVKIVRNKFMDSIKLVRKKRVDSLAKVKADKEKLAKAKEKKKEDALKFKMELKIKQKHEAWSNKTMLKKRWSLVRKVTQNSFTHYNYYYNANKKMDEALVNMQRSRKENYDSLIGLYPFDPNRDSTLMSADMDSIIRKVSVGIQIHDPRVKWSNDLYLLLGEAYYYRGNYENASIAFRYIISKDEEKKKEEAKKNGYSNKSKDAPSILEDEQKSGFLKHKSVHNEAILWLARTYTAANQAENAESVLSLLESDARLPEDLKGRLATEKAFAYLAENNYPEAAIQLAITEDDNSLPGWLRMRAAFIHGQLLQNLGDYSDAANSFEKVLGYYPKIEMDFYARKYMAYNKLLAGRDVAEAMRPLKNVLNDGKYVNYYDQVYFVLGTLAVKAHKTDDAVKYLTKSTTTPKATKKQKALSFAALGDVYYAAADYPAAKGAYDSAAKYSSAASKDKTIAAAIQKSKGLEEISGPMKVIHDQDSLRELSKLSKKEQQSVVRRYLRYLEQKQLDSITAAENSGVTSVAPADQNNETQDAASNWYFSNPALMQQGSADFKRKWGNRPLTDNWRRSSSGSLANNNGGQNELDDYQAGNAQGNGMPTEENLMAKIPNTPQQKELSVKVEQRAYLLLAKAYMKLENYNQSIHTLDTLDSRFPNHNLKEEVLYLRYQMALKQNKLDKAQTYSQQLLSQFPNSQYAGSLRPKQSESKGEAVTGKSVAAYYDETYNLLTQHQFTEALMHINIAKQQYDHPTFKKRFDIAEAMTYTGMGDYDKADTILVKFLKAYPSDTLTSWAKEVQVYIKEVRNGGKPSWYYDTVRTETTVTKNGTKPGVPAPKPVAPAPPPVVANIPAMYSYHA
ncbi:MAG: tetratricopeptide repeat protein, partial [Chitinophagales bacterium]